MNVTYPKGPAGLSDDFAKPSPAFTASVRKMIAFIVFYFVVYVLLLLVGFAIAATLAYAGVALMAFHLRFFTVIAGCGLILAGLLVLYFLVKFLFETKKADTTGYKELTEAEQPELFAFVRKVSEECGTAFPKKIFLTGEVNAAVFYDSTFLSMFLPTPKNLVIGLGLINIVNLSEFKAILAHEFGHFSQKSMRAGSYVYQVNRVIYNMLFENEGYGDLLQKVANLHGILSVCIWVTTRIVYAIQWVQKQAYVLVNKQYNHLSRQMEFHADAISAMVAGSNNAILALKISAIGDSCYQQVLQTYQRWLTENVKGNNLYTDQRTSAYFFAKSHRIPMANDLPVLKGDTIFNADLRRINIEDQWASHPTTEQREEALTKLGVSGEVSSDAAWVLFKNAEILQTTFTADLYNNVKMADKAAKAGEKRFEEALAKELAVFETPELYGDYYKNRLISTFDTTNVTGDQVKITDIVAFSKENTLISQQQAALEQDIAELRQLAENPLLARNFSFDGEIYRAKLAATVLTTLEQEAKKIGDTLIAADQAVYLYCYHNTRGQQEKNTLQAMYKHFHNILDLYNKQINRYSSILETVGALYVDDPTYDIYKESPQDLQEPVSTLKELYTEITDHLASAYPEYGLKVPEKVVVYMEDEVKKVLVASRMHAEQVNCLYDNALELVNWTKECCLVMNKMLLEYQANGITAPHFSEKEAQV